VLRQTPLVAHWQVSAWVRLPGVCSQFRRQTNFDGSQAVCRCPCRGTGHLCGFNTAASLSGLALSACAQLVVGGMRPYVKVQDALVRPSRLVADEHTSIQSFLDAS